MAQTGDRAKQLGRELLGGGDSLAVERFRQRLLGALEIEEGRGRLALDLGCGDGLEAVYLARHGWKVEALDLESHPRWEILKRRYGKQIRFRTADAQALSKIRRTYDLVFEKDMLHHVPSPVAVLKEMRRLTKPRGKAVVVECNRANPVFYLHLTLMLGHQHFTLARLKQLLEQAGMSDHALKRIEARVWPLENETIQNAAEKLQDLAEALPFWRPFVCYHAMTWKRP